MQDLDVTENLGVLRDQVYDQVRSSLTRGHYVAGQKLVIRQLASEYGTSLTPVRECLRRLVAEGVLDGKSNRSVYVPRMTGPKIRELRDIRLSVEPLATRRAAERITRKEIDTLRKTTVEIASARSRGDVEADVAKIGEFHFGVYRAARMPHLVRIIESLWLQTGPYLKLLFPNYIEIAKVRQGDWRNKLCDALEKRDDVSAASIMTDDIAGSLDYLVDLVDAAETLGKQ